MSPDDGEQDIARVLRNTGPRQAPPAEMLRSVHAAVESEWRSVVTARRTKRVAIWSIAAGLLAVAVAGAFFLTSSQAPGTRVADVSAATGLVQAKNGTWKQLRPLQRQQHVAAGDVVSTGANGRLALALDADVSLRLDHDTRVTFEDTRHVRIDSGTVYVDSGMGAQPYEERLQILTPAGSIQHVGTQYEVQLIDRAVRIAVREGKIELSGAGGEKQHAIAGEQMTVSGGGAIARTSIRRDDSSWQWASQIAPGFDIDGHSVADFLAWVARETGRDIMFATPAVEAEASRVMLSGSIAQLTPEDALAAVLPTTSLRSEDIGGKLVISLAVRP